MKRVLKIIFCALIVDFFYFSSGFPITRGVNTKLILAVIGLVTFFIKSAHDRSMKVSRQMIVLTLLALGVSAATLFSMIYNNTGDRAYLTYVISMLVWLTAAYMVFVILNAINGKVSIELIADYIIVISFLQCTIALLGNMFEPVNRFIKFLYPWVGWLDTVDRMYGIGDTTTLDTGGIRYGIACILCAHMLVKTGANRKKCIPWYLFAYVFITIVGNMIARTTLVGSVIGLVYLIVFLAYPHFNSSALLTKTRVLGWFTVILAVMIGASVLLYNTNDTIRKNLRFGFEGFFSLAEKGEWDVGSNNVLRSMYVFPDNPKTWIIGDGYFINPSGDPNYIGEVPNGYYKDTDVGYLRFIFYFGLVGLGIFSIMILYAGYICLIRFPGNALLFFSLVLCHFVVWMKVSTDCFFILGLFIAMAYVRDNYGKSEQSVLTE